MTSSVLFTVFRSFTAPMEMAPSALAGEGTRFVPSLPIATMQTMPASRASFTRRASAPDPLSPSSPGFNGLLSEPKDMEPMSMPRLESLLPQFVSLLLIIHWMPLREAWEFVPPESVRTLMSTRNAPMPLPV